MTAPNIPAEATLSANLAKIAAEGLTAPWQRYKDEAFAEYVHDGEKAITIAEYFARNLHKSPEPAAPAINPPMPAPPVAPAAPAINPPMPAAPVAPVAPAAPAATSEVPTAPPGESNEQTALYQRLQARGLIPANRSGRKPAVAKLRAMDAWGWSIDQFSAWETAEKAKGAASAYDATMAAFTPATPAAPAPVVNPTPAAVSVPAAATPAAVSVPAPVANPTPAAPVANPTPAAPVANPTPAAPVAGSRLGFVLAINATCSANSVDFNRDILPTLQARIAGTDVTMDNGFVRRFGSYGELPFGRGIPLVNAALAEYLTTNAAKFGAGSVVTVDTNTPAGRDNVDILRAFAAMEFRGF